MPAITRVVHMEPGPTPTFTPSAPALITASAPSPVPMFPAISSTLGKFDFVDFTASMTFFEWPWAVSIIITSHPTSIRASILSSLSGPTPTAAPHRSLPMRSLDAVGYFSIFSMSFIVISPRSLNSLSTTGSFSILYLWRSSFASSSVVPSPTVMSFFFGVMICSTLKSRFFSKRRSLKVTIPRRVSSSFVTGRPVMFCLSMISRASATLCLGLTVRGFTIIPLSYFFTLFTSDV